MQSAADIVADRLYINPPGPVRAFGVWRDGLNEISSEGLDGRRKRLLFRCRHRGIREMDLVLGRFAEVYLTSLSDAELSELEHWLEIPDQQMFTFVNGVVPPPAALDTPLFRRLCALHGRAQ